MMKKMMYTASVITLLMSLNGFAGEDTCLGRNLTLYNRPGSNQLEEKIGQLYPNQEVHKMYENILAMAPSGTCDTVWEDQNTVSTIINEKKFISAIDAVIKLQSQCKDNRIWSNIGTAGNLYLTVGKCSRFTSPALDSNVYEIVQKLSPTSAVYKNGNSSFVVYKNKSGLPNYLKGIFKQTGVSELTDSYGRVRQLLEVTKISDFKDPKLLKSN